MTLRWVLATIHLLALGIGMGAVWSRSRALRGPLDTAALRRAFAADAWWGIAALLWVVTGLWRLFAGTEKVPTYYTANHWFWAKMSLFVLVLLLEMLPMITLIRWRAVVARGETPDTDRAGTLATISLVQAVLVALMVGAAAAMARGYGA